MLSPLLMSWSRADFIEQYDWAAKGVRQYSGRVGEDTLNLDVYLCFDDIRHAAKASGEIQMVDSNMDAEYVSQAEFCSAKNRNHHGPGEDTSFTDGQVVFQAYYEGGLDEKSAAIAGLYGEVKKLAETYGDVLGFAEHHMEDGLWQFRCEYFKISAAKTVLRTVTQMCSDSTDVSTLPFLSVI